jgi:hypothetical protein
VPLASAKLRGGRGKERREKREKKEENNEKGKRARGERRREEEERRSKANNNTTDRHTDSTDSTDRPLLNGMQASDCGADTFSGDDGNAVQRSQRTHAGVQGNRAKR